MNVTPLKIGHDLNNKMVQKLTLEKELTKNGLLNRYSPMIFFQILSIFDIKVQFCHFLSNRHSSTEFLQKIPLSMLILGQTFFF